MVVILKLPLLEPCDGRIHVGTKPVLVQSCLSVGNSTAHPSGRGAPLASRTTPVTLMTLPVTTIPRVVVDPGRTVIGCVLRSSPSTVMDLIVPPLSRSA